MTSKTVFQNHLNSEIGKIGKLATKNPIQVSQFSQFPGLGEARKRLEKNNP